MYIHMYTSYRLTEAPRYEKKEEKMPYIISIYVYCNLYSADRIQFLSHSEYNLCLNTEYSKFKFKKTE